MITMLPACIPLARRSTKILLSAELLTEQEAHKPAHQIDDGADEAGGGGEDGLEGGVEGVEDAA